MRRRRRGLPLRPSASAFPGDPQASAFPGDTQRPSAPYVYGRRCVGEAWMSPSLRDWDKRLEVRERSRWLFGAGRLNRGQPLPHAAGERDDSFALVAVECFAQRRGSGVATAGGFEHLGEVTVPLALARERIGPRPPVDCFLGEPHRLDVLSACRVDESLRDRKSTR